MAGYIYYCEHCRTSFERETADAEADAPETAICPNCGRPDADRAFPAELLRPAADACAPGSGC
jgi:NAD-dependent SIR2 family protein deacetylase